jgi:hypothetical protein
VWATRTAEQATDGDPLATDACAQAQQAHAAVNQTAMRQMEERRQLREAVYGPHRPGSGLDATEQVTVWRRQAKEARTDLAHTEAMPIDMAAHHIRQRAADATTRAAQQEA